MVGVHEVLGILITAGQQMDQLENRPEPSSYTFGEPFLVLSGHVLYNTHPESGKCNIQTQRPFCLSNKKEMPSCQYLLKPLQAVTLTLCKKRFYNEAQEI